MNKDILIFLAGVGVGMLGGAYLMYRKMKEVVLDMQDDCEADIEDMRAYYIEKYSQEKDEELPIEEPAKELSRASYTDYIDEHKDSDSPKVAYNNITGQASTEIKSEIETEDPPEAVKHLSTESDYETASTEDQIELFLFDTEDEDRKIIVDRDEEFYDFNLFRKAYMDSDGGEDLYCKDPLTNKYYWIRLRGEEYAKGIVDDILYQESW